VYFIYNFEFDPAKLSYSYTLVKYFQQSDSEDIVSKLFGLFSKINSNGG